jgi:hypothetical protein
MKKIIKYNLILNHFKEKRNYISVSRRSLPLFLCSAVLLYTVKVNSRENKKKRGGKKEGKKEDIGLLHLLNICSTVLPASTCYRTKLDKTPYQDGKKNYM